MQPPPPPPPSLTLRTPPFAHYNIAWSPFHTNRLGLASAANYGLVGNGRLHLTSLFPTEMRLDKTYDTQDGLYDLAWSEIHENQIVTASGDGSLKLWDIMLKDLPIRAWHEHTREAFSVDWSNLNKELFCSASWDGSVKIYTPDRPTSIQSIPAHGACVYQAEFSPHTPQMIASCSTDGTLRLFDLRSPLPPSSSSAPVVPGAPQPQPPTNANLTVPAHPSEILSLSWNKYRPFVIATAGVDKSVKSWDCRMIKTSGGGVGGTCEIELKGHEYAVRKVQWSPHRSDVLASASYDMTCRVWSTAPQPGQPSLRSIHDLHTEFVVGCAWSLYEEGVLASCSWDCGVHVFRPPL